MSWDVWIGFAAASLAMGVIPGPGVTSIVGYALSSGRGTALMSVAGMAVGNAVAMSLSLAGAGAVLRASAHAFVLLKWAGATYLIAVGLLTLANCVRPAGPEASRAPISRRTAFLGNVLIGTFHPKTIVFFVAFAPQFINPRALYLPQATVLIATFCGIVGVTDTVYALAAARASRHLGGARAALWSRRAGGGVLVAAGVATATTR